MFNILRDRTFRKGMINIDIVKITKNILHHLHNNISNFKDSRTLFYGFFEMAYYVVYTSLKLAM